MRVFRIRPARVSDLPSILAIEREAFPTPWSEEDFRQEFRKPYSYFWVAVNKEGEVIGYICFWLVADEMQLANLAVQKAWRRRGIGQSLLRLALKVARLRGARRAILEVRENNLPAIRLYRRLGFQIEGVRRAYYRDTGEDALLMGLSLT